MLRQFRSQRVGQRHPLRVLVEALVVAIALADSDRVWGCDLCAVYTATEAEYGTRRFGLGVAQQFTRFATLQDEGKVIPNVAGERIESSITQVYGTVKLHPWLSLQLNVPLVSKSFRRLTANGIEKGDETGVGDIVVLGNVSPYSYVEGDVVARVAGLVAVKLPTGDAELLGQERASTHTKNPCDDPFFPRTVPCPGNSAGHNHGGSGVHVHDLTLGSGSTDVVIGAQSMVSWERFLATASIQYAIRTTGAFDYRYANDLLWYAGPGYFVVLHDDYSVGIQAMFSGEAKGKDTQDGTTIEDSAMTSVYSGPAIRATWTDRFAADLGLDLPLLLNNSAVQIVPDYRIRGAITWRF